MAIPTIERLVDDAHRRAERERAPVLVKPGAGRARSMSVGTMTKMPRLWEWIQDVGVRLPDSDACNETAETVMLRMHDEADALAGCLRPDEMSALDFDLKLKTPCVLKPLLARRIKFFTKKMHDSVLRSGALSDEEIVAAHRRIARLAAVAFSYHHASPAPEDEWDPQRYERGQLHDAVSRLIVRKNLRLSSQAADASVSSAGTSAVELLEQGILSHKLLRLLALDSLREVIGVSSYLKGKAA